MPFTKWKNLSPGEREMVEELALLEGIAVSEENCSRLLEECRKSATGNRSKQFIDSAKKELWGE